MDYGANELHEQVKVSSTSTIIGISEAILTLPMPHIKTRILYFFGEYRLFDHGHIFMMRHEVSHLPAVESEV
jgi:hypothetical protein